MVGQILVFQYTKSTPEAKAPFAEQTTPVLVSVFLRKEPSAGEGLQLA